MSSFGAGPAIQTKGLTKTYAGVDALSDLSLTVERGALYGFLGPNGAGKTTTIRLLMGFIKPSRGSSRMFDHDTWSDGVRARSQVGYLVQADSLFQILPEPTSSPLPRRCPVRKRPCKPDCSMHWSFLKPRSTGS